MLIRNNKDFKSNVSILWLCQLIASTSWMASVFVYGSFVCRDLLRISALIIIFVGLLVVSWALRSYDNVR